MKKSEAISCLKQFPRDVISTVDIARNWQIARAVNALPGIRVLDVGCGHGALESVLNSGKEVLGVDMDPERLQMARQYNANKPQTSFEKVDLFRLEGEWSRNRAPFDIVILSEVLEHLPEEDHVLQIMRQLLAPHGSLVITVPNALRFKNRLLRRYQRGSDMRMAPDHVREYTSTSLCQALERNGFQVVALEGVCIRLPGDRLSCAVMPYHSAVREWLTRQRPDWSTYYMAVASKATP